MNARNIRQQEIRKLVNTAKGVVELAKGVQQSRNNANGVYGGGAIQLGRLILTGCAARMGTSGCNTVG